MNTTPDNHFAMRCGNGCNKDNFLKSKWALQWQCQWTDVTLIVINVNQGPQDTISGKQCLYLNTNRPLYQAPGMSKVCLMKWRIHSSSSVFLFFIVTNNKGNEYLLSQTLHFKHLGSWFCMAVNVLVSHGLHLYVLLPHLPATWYPWKQGNTRDWTV